MKAFLIKSVLKMYISTFRYNLTVGDNVQKLLDEGKRLVLCSWHNQLGLIVGKADHYRAVTMISRSKDGEILANVVKSMGMEVVRASSSKGASTGTMEMLEYMKKGHHAIMAVDGPKGPVYEFKSGTLYLAKKTDKVIVPIVCNCKRFFRFNSWDKFLLPKPFAKIDIYLPEAFVLSDSVEKADVEKEAKEVENKMMELTRVYSKDII